jgi:hypothetical protein
MTSEQYLKNQRAYLDDLKKCRRELWTTMWAQYDAFIAADEISHPKPKRSLEAFVGREVGRTL